MRILVLNSGSSSVKYQLLNMKQNKLLAKGLIEKIGFDESIVSYKNHLGKKIKKKIPIKNHSEGIKQMLEALLDKEHGVITSIDDISAVGHRITQGGATLKESVLITEDIKKKIEECFPLAPLHNPPQYKGVLAIEEIMPGIPNVATFDTAFHKDIPEYAYIYGIPYEWYEKYGVRKYGYHGQSHDYVSKRAAEILNEDINDLKIITCHLGNGASVSAIKEGKSIENSMGFTPLAGLVMGTRCGDIDPQIVPNMMEAESLNKEDIFHILNKESGVKGISGVSSDFRDIEEAAAAGNERAKLALEVFDYRVRLYIGSYMAALNGLDVLVFTAGLGENSPETRESVCSGLTGLGIEIDKEKNKFRGKELVISTPESKVKVIVIPTNEEMVIARETLNIVSSLN